MSTINSTNSTNSTGFNGFISAQLVLARQTTLTSSLGGSLSATADGEKTLASANSALFGMANLVARVRALNSQAATLNDSDAKGVEALRSAVNDALAQFNKIAATGVAGTTTAAGATTLIAAGITGAAGSTGVAAGAATGSTAVPLSLADLRKELAAMQLNLHDNIGKVGVGIQKALAYNSHPTSNAVASKYSSNSLYSLFAKLYGNSSNSV